MLTFSRTCVALFLFALTLFAHAGTLEKAPDPNHHKSRGMQSHKLSEKTRSDDVGDYEYDHGAFLGDDYSDVLDHLSPEESERRLMIIVEKIDEDKNGFLSAEELTLWIRNVSEKEAIRESDEQWFNIANQEQTHITWEQYREKTYGIFEKKDHEDEVIHHGYNISGMVNRDQKRFNTADLDHNNALDRTEFTYFVHPEEYYHMKDVIAEETLQDMDTDKDGKISLQEFIDDIWRAQPGEEEPDWVISEKQQFSEVRDKDKDGFLNVQEILEWIIPENHDLPEIEANHLMTTVDVDKDNLLSRNEIRYRWNVFVGSTATQYGELLARHDEF